MVTVSDVLQLLIGFGSLVVAGISLVVAIIAVTQKK
ncbi:putative holin-like toxin [Bacillus haikouensis]|nr:putative holin-like toxin [Bacillus haikouensis]NQD68314.1 putative holin-like toxin [Bacillus haikouensis]